MLSLCSCLPSERPHQQRAPYREPWLTCSSIADCGPSATSPVISSPRIIGPGCITTAFAPLLPAAPPFNWYRRYTPPGPARSPPAAPSGCAASSPRRARASAASKSRTISIAGARPQLIFRQQLHRPAQHHLRPQPRQQHGIRPRHAAMQNVARNRHRHAVQRLRIAPYLRATPSRAASCAGPAAPATDAGASHRPRSAPAARSRAPAATPRPTTDGAG